MNADSAATDETLASAPVRILLFIFFYSSVGLSRNACGLRERRSDRTLSAARKTGPGTPVNRHRLA